MTAKEAGRGTAHPTEVIRRLRDATAAIASAPVDDALKHLVSEVAGLVDAAVVSCHMGDHITTSATTDDRLDLDALRVFRRLEVELAHGGRAVRLRAADHSEGALGPVIAAILATDGNEPTDVVFAARTRGSRDFDDTELAILEQLASVAGLKRRRAGELAAGMDDEARRFRDELLAGMSHDMHTPLSVIVGIADALTEEPDLPQNERLAIYETVARQARRLRSLVNQFLDFSRIEADRPLSVDLQDIDVVEVIDHVVPLFTHQREIVVGAEEGLPHALGDKERLEQILINLVSNAIKYSDGPIRVVARRPDDDILIDVVDEGPGLTDHEIDKIFEKFHRGAAATGTRGTGLGLYISRALARAQGGELTAMSSGMGSRFRVRVPVAPEG
ncbi:MAG: HAMP domain-containing sensor histidine kinase [Nitriliruptorales bacterium]|nr:HAMP domain-containing sensor histidine kinase [Nitriliruptorales bacterium]